ncbi:MAG: serine hydrolase domain-containing protein [Congregibacter sp.]
MNAFDRLLDAGIKAGAAPGATAVVVNRRGPVWEGAAGERELDSGVTMTNDTVGAIFSMTKALTGVAAMQLVEQNRLSLDAPAGEVIPWLGEVQVLEGFDDSGEPVTRPPRTPVTLRNLLTHTSGFVYEMWNADTVAWREKTGTPSFSTALNAGMRAPLAFDPGTAWEYGIGIDWVGKMVEAVSGQSLGDYFAEHVTGPMRMHDTAFDLSPSMAERAAGMHARAPDGSLIPINVSPPPNPEYQMGGGGLNGTMRDYGRFLQMMLNDGELDGQRLLKAKTVEMMATNQMGDLQMKPLKTVMPNLSNDADLFPGEPKSWGLTFMINESPLETGRPAGGLMWAGLANSYYWIDRKNGIGGAYMSQILPFADAKSMNLFMDIEREAYRQLAQS